MSMTISTAAASAEAVVPAERTVDIADRVRRIADTDPHRVALIHAHRLPGGRLRYRRKTYGELSDRAERLAVGLRAAGIAEQARCSFMVPPGFDAMALGLALWRVGAVVVGIEPHSHGLRKVGRSLAKADPEVFIGTPRAHAARRAFGWGSATVRRTVVVSRLPLPGVITTASLARGPVPDRPVSGAIEPADPAVIAFTTGSTGAPKPTVLRQRNLAAMIDNVLGHWDLGEGREVVDMPTFPMFWIIGLAAGGTVVVPPMDFTLHGPGDADPALLTNLARYADEHGCGPIGVRRIVAGGAEVPGPLFAAVRSVLGPDGELYSDYGATEALPVAEIAGAEVVADTWPRTERGAGVCVGRPLPGVEVRIVDIDDGPIARWDDARPVPAGTIGEVVARGPHISEGYDRQPRADAENKIAADDGGRAWHRLGDTGYLDAGGRLWVCGRRSHRVVVDERTTAFPLCCEPVANAVTGVARSALVALEDPDGSSSAVLCIEPVDPSCDRAALSRSVLERLARVESSRAVGRVAFVDRLPVDRRHNAKLDRPRIAAMVAALGPDAVVDRSDVVDGSAVDAGAPS